MARRLPQTTRIEARVGMYPVEEAIIVRNQKHPSHCRCLDINFWMCFIPVVFSVYNNRTDQRGAKQPLANVRRGYGSMSMTMISEV